MSMGFWGFAPFQNDYALDEYGGYNTSRHLTGLIWQGIKRGGEYSLDVHEILGMILRTFKLYDGICTEADEIEMIKAIATGQKIKVHPDVLKAKIHSGEIIVDNMQLTSDNRLISKQGG